MKRTLSLFLSLNFLAMPLAQALGSLPQLTSAQSLVLARNLTRAEMPRAFQTLRNMNIAQPDMESALAKISKSKSAEFTAHIGQTLLFLLTMTAIDIIYQEIKKGNANSLEDKAAEVATQLLSSGTGMLNSGNFLTALGGGSATAAAMKYPVEVLTGLIANPESHKILIKTLTGSILATGSFLGWDAGAQLWTEAAYQIKDPQDYERTKSVFGMGAGALRGLFLNPSPQNERDLRLAGTMIYNLMNVALFDQDLRANWLSNTWRTRYMSGDEVTLMGCIVAGGIAGTMLMPGGGTIAGAMFGLGGYAVSLVIPQAAKDEITIGMQDLRSRFTNMGLTSNEVALQEATAADSVLLIKRRHVLRSNYLTIDFERLRMDFKMLFNGSSNLAATQTDVRATFTDMTQLLDLETGKLTQIAGKNPAISAGLVEEWARVAFLKKFMSDVADGVNTALSANVEKFDDLSSDGKDYVKFIEISYARGFTEDKFFKTAQTPQ